MYGLLSFCSVVVSFNQVFTVNILYVSPVPSPSHHIWNRALAFELAKKGYNVTLIGPDEDQVKPVNYTHVLIEGLYDEFHDNVDLFGMAQWSSSRMLKEFVEMGVTCCQTIIKSQGLRKLLNYPADFKFDLIIIEVTMGPCLYPLIHRFNYPPTLAVTPFPFPPYVAFNFGNHLYPAYIPWHSLPYTNKMTFMERLWNFVFTYADVGLRHFKQFKEQHQLAAEAFGRDIPTMEELQRHINIILGNTDPVFDSPQPLSTNIIPVGGLQTRKSKQISMDLLSVLDGAKNGVIVFSLGTNIRSDQLGEKRQRAVLDAFGKISETVIWKFEGEIKNLPKNVIVRKWLPQNEILGHPNVKLFIGHGGALSTQEAIFHGVPMICVPFFMDQHINTRNAVDRKLGIHLDFEKITSDYILEKLREILYDPTYTENMQRTSRVFRDRTETPLERGIFWAEYVLRHGGADFLNTAARDLPFYKTSGLDVLGFLALIVTAILITVYKLGKLISTGTKNTNYVRIKIN